jgi:putative N6-adenine-specific DNA methylase
MDGRYKMIAKTLYGLEDVLAEELTALKADHVETGRRMVSFEGDNALMYRANLYCRTALRILKPILHFKADNADAVYENVKKIEWDTYFSPDQTFAVESVIYSERFHHSRYVAYRTKDAIVDYFNEKCGCRPGVRVSRPDMYIHIHISHDDCTVSLDSSGESLHKRGYRMEQVEAPLNEVLAAGMILKTGWRGESDFIDPMCGSGTLLIEAAMIALNIPPGIYRKEYAFEHWHDFDSDLFDEIYDDESGEREFNYKCYGSDISPTAIEIAAKNVHRAGLDKYIELKTMPFQQYVKAPPKGIFMTNPPYGERIKPDDISGLYGMIGERLKHVFTGYQAWILSHKAECFDKIGLHHHHRIPLMNGSLNCELRCYEIFAGKNKDYKKALNDHAGKPRLKNANVLRRTRERNSKSRQNGN